MANVCDPKLIWTWSFHLVLTLQLSSFPLDFGKQRHTCAAACEGLTSIGKWTVWSINATSAIPGPACLGLFSTVSALWTKVWMIFQIGVWFGAPLHVLRFQAARLGLPMLLLLMLLLLWSAGCCCRRAIAFNIWATLSAVNQARKMEFECCKGALTCANYIAYLQGARQHKAWEIIIWLGLGANTKKTVNQCKLGSWRGDRARWFCVAEYTLEERQEGREPL